MTLRARLGISAAKHSAGSAKRSVHSCGPPPDGDVADGDVAGDE
jgi:hypothetical protein